MSRFSLFLVLCLLTVQAHAAQLTADQLCEDFEYFWNSYREAYVFFDLKAQDYGVDWDQLKAEYSATLAQCKTKADLVRLISEFQARLHDGHAGNEGLMSLGPIALQPAAFVAGEGSKVFVGRVRANSELQAAGIERGDELLRFGGQPIATLRRKIRAFLPASSEGQFLSLTARMGHIWHPLLGPAPETCKMTFRKPDGSIVDVECQWEYFNPSGGKEGPSLDKVIELDAHGALPMKARIYEDLNLAYVSIESFMKTEDPTEQFDRIFTAIKDTDGMIIDVRGNGGGVGTWGILLASYFIDPDGQPCPNDTYMERNYSETFFRMVFQQVPPEQLEQLFTDPASMREVFARFGIKMTLEEMKRHFVDGRYKPFYFTQNLCDKKPGVPVYTKPVVALTDGGCFSTTDIFLTLLREFNRVTIVGTPNGAGSGSPIPFVLPNSKIKVMVPHARAYPPSGRMIEGRPLTPDIVVEVNSEALVAGRDEHLLQGLQTLAERTGLTAPGTRRSHSVRFSPSELLTTTVYDNTDENMIPPEIRAIIPTSVMEGRINELMTGKVQKR